MTHLLRHLVSLLLKCLDQILHGWAHHVLNEFVRLRARVVGNVMSQRHCHLHSTRSLMQSMPFVILLGKLTLSAELPETKLDHRRGFDALYSAVLKQIQIWIR